MTTDGSSRISVNNLLNPVNQIPASRPPSPPPPPPPMDIVTMRIYGSPPPQDTFKTRVSRHYPADAPQTQLGPRDESVPGTQPCPVEPKIIFDNIFPDEPPIGNRSHG